MKISCRVIQDLLPLYAESMASDESNLLIEKHIADCEKCKNKLNSIKANITTNKPDTGVNASLKFIQKNLKKRKVESIAFVSLLVFLSMFTVFAYLTKPEYISYENSGISISQLENQEVYANFSEKVTSYRAIRYNSQDDQVVMEIQAWTSAWDKLLDKSTPSVLISNSDKKVDTVYYCDCTTKDNNITVVYGINSDTNGGITFLPRLILGYYFMAALISSIIVGALWILSRKNNRLSDICKYLFFVPTSYLLSHLLLNTRFISFSSTRDFIINFIASIAIYGISILGITLFKQYKLDKIK